MLLSREINKEEKLDEICESLNELIRNELKIDLNFSYYGDEKEGYYTIHNKNKSNEEKRVDLNMRLYFEKEKENFLYAYIMWFSVNPKKVGIGSNIIKEIINILKDLTTIEFIIIHPKDKEVKSFWIKNNFKEDINKILKDKRVILNNRRILSLYIKENLCFSDN